MSQRSCVTFPAQLQSSRVQDTKTEMRKTGSHPTGNGLQVQFLLLSIVLECCKRKRQSSLFYSVSLKHLTHITTVHPKGDQSWVFIGRTDTIKLKLQYFGHLMRRADSLKKTLMLGGAGGRKRRGQQDEMAGWHHRLDAQEFG